MKTRLPFVLCCFALLGAALMQAHAEPSKAAASPQLLRHVVMFKFKKEASQAQIDDLVQAFGELPQKIDTIQSYEWGTNNSPEMLDKGFTHLFLVTFKDEAGRAKYLPHPAHKAFVEKLKPILEEPMVVDYWAK
jgi:quinol monooxygenase YgiN